MKSLTLLALLAACGAAQAQSLDMEYCYEEGIAGTFDYTFTVRTDTGWAPGMGWRWLIFADAPLPPSPFLGYIGDPASFPVGPWTSNGFTSGGHNGPDFSFVLDYWIPSTGSEVLTWKGTALVALDEPNMLFSTIAGTVGGAVAAEFKVAKQIECDTPCYADCDLNGTLDFFDFLCFQNLFAAGSNGADCDGSGTLDFFDFLCFQNAFAVGCP